MILLDQSYLAGLGLTGVSAEQVNFTLSAIYAATEFLVGSEVAGRLDDGLMDEFDEFLRTEDTNGALAFLEEALPDYVHVVGQQFAIVTQRMSAIAAVARVVLRS